MKRATTFLFLLSCTSVSALAANPVTQPVIIQVQKLANASVCEAYKSDASSLGKAIDKQCRNRARAEFDAIEDEKTLKDCMKPGNVIDEDVRKCMKGI